MRKHNGMNKTWMALALAMAATTAWAQPAKRVTAFNYMQSGEWLKAKDFIDEAIVHEKTINDEKTWRYRGQIYQNLALQDDFDKKTAVQESLRSFARAMELDPKGIWKKENFNEGYAQVQALVVNLGILAFNQSDFNGASEFFMLAANAAEKVGVTDTMAIYNTGLAAEQAGKYDVAINYYKRCVDMGYLKAQMYIYLANAYNKKDDEEGYLRVIQEGRKNYPTNADLLIYELNYYLRNNRFEEAERNLQAAIGLDPTNKQLFFSLGVVYDNLGMREKAIKSYQSAIQIDGSYFDAVYNLGALYFNQGVEMNNKANDIQDNKKYEAAKAEAKKVFQEALPFLEKAHDLDGSDRAALASLVQAYAMLNMNDKYTTAKAKLDALK
jgi:tetratricopeptide (TPR) repeat protein